jgi:hypothetical protein
MPSNGASLPTGDVLNHRGMATVPACSLCGVDDSWMHSLMECAMARLVWALMDEELVEHMALIRFGTLSNGSFLCKTR